MISFNNLGSLGHLGNQMFQYASLRGIAKNRNFEWCIPPKELLGIGYNPRSNIYDCFNLSSLKEENINYLQNINLEESMYGFDENLFNNCPDNVNLNGYFQNPKYFKNIEKEIKNDFTFKDKIISSIEPLEDYACVHLRRTDYVNNDGYKNLNWDYYSSCISMIPENIKIIIVSDDIEWCMSQEYLNRPRFVFSKNNAYQDLYLIANAKYVIIANSTFSWWGAWLNEKANKIIAPSEWFGPLYKNQDTSKLYPESWITI